MIALKLWCDITSNLDAVLQIYNLALKICKCIIT